MIKKKDDKEKPKETHISPEESQKTVADPSLMQQYNSGITKNDKLVRNTPN